MKTIKELCRDLRKNQTDAEKRLWKLLRNRKLQGFKFLRQYPLAKISYQGHRKFYIADFYCSEKRLVIEADGSIHDVRKDYDKNRDDVLQSLAIRTLRFSNDKVLTQTELVLNEILEVLKSD